MPEGILWIVKTGACLLDLPKEYPPYKTCRRRFQQWVDVDVFDKIIEALARDLQERGGIDMSEFLSTTPSQLPKGGFMCERLNAVKAPSSWQLRTLMVVLVFLFRSNLQTS
ncbi:transposase [Flavisolibacter nicotianae]|uniref:transposase n=1 Tax=Flavisolibacter nicotianae TaxID=2364882 RepID=UPI000EB2AC18|nr:transposase [Flavisolibacter nicotianae]